MFFLIFLVFLGSNVSAASEWDYLCKGLDPFEKIPHPYDCKQYIQCMEGDEAFLGACPSGTAFDIKIANCLPESMVDCSHISTPSSTESTSTESTESTQSTTPTTSTTTGSQAGDWDYLCKDKPENTRVPHPYDCKKFFQCMANEEALAGECQDDQAFDKDVLFCLPEAMVDCSHISTTISPAPTSSTETTPIETTTEDDTTTETTTEPTTSSTTTESTSTSTESTTSSTESTSTESSTEAETTTSEETTTEQSTTSSSSTSTSSGTITYPPGSSISPGPEIPEPGVQCPPLSQTEGKPVFLPSKLDCEKYYLCYVGLPVPFKCQTGTHFNRFEENCDDPYFAHCQVKGFVDPNPFPECPRHGIFNLPRVNNCEFFVHCNEGIGRLQKCPFYYGWDVTMHQCVMRNQAKCA